MVKRSFIQLSTVLISMTILIACAPSPTLAPTPAPAVVAPTAAPPTTAPTVAVVSATAAPTAAPATSAPTTAAIAPTVAGGTLIWARSGIPDTLDPQKATGIEAFIVQLNIFDPLVWRNPDDNQYYPGLAKSWTFAADGKSMTIELRADVKFHDGTPLNADAVKFNFDRIMDPATKAATAASFMGSFQSSEVTGPYTLKINFKEPNASFLEWLTHPSLSPVSPTAVKKFADKFGDNPVGAGPFMFKSWDRGTNEVTLVHNPDYKWAPSFFKNQGPPYLDTLVMKGILDSAVRTAVLEAGQVDASTLLPDADNLRLKADPKYTVWSVPGAGVIHSLAMNITKPPLDDINVRKALITSVDLKALQATVFKNLHGVPVGPFRGATPCRADVTSVWPYDPDNARKLLDNAGWKVGSDGIREKNGTKLSVTTFWSDADDSAPIVFLQGEWRKQLGYDLKINTFDFNAVIAQSAQGLHQMTWGSTSGSDPDVARTVFATGGPRNFTRVSDPQLDQWLTQGAQTFDMQARCKIYTDVQKRIMDLALIMPYADLKTYAVSTAKVTGLRYRGDGVMPWNYEVQKKP